MITTYETLKVSREGAVQTIELHRPDSLNALTPQTAEDLKAALDLALDDDVRAVLLTGAGRAFSSGADLKEGMGWQTPSGRPDFARALREKFNPPVRAIRDLPKPVVAAVNGPAVGIAVSYALACDFVLAARSAYFFLSFLNVGLTPDGGASALITARVGVARFNEMALLAEKVPAERAFEWGLIDRLEDDDALLGAAQALAARLADGPTQAQANVKRMVNRGPLAGLDAALELEAVLQNEAGEGDEFIEGVSAFMQKRPPRFNAG